MRTHPHRIAALLLLTSCLALGIEASAQAFSEVGSIGELGSGPGQLKGPSAAAVDDATHDVYVADTGNNRVEEFTAAGAFVLMFGKEVNETKKTNVCTSAEIETEHVTCGAGVAGAGAGAAEFTKPRGVAVDNSGGPDAGDVYVADTSNGRIEVFSPTGAYLAEFDGSKTPDGSFEHPRGLAVDGLGDVYIADQFHGVVDKFAPLGAGYLAAPYLHGLSNPTDVAVDSNAGSEAIYVANRFTNVEKFNYTTGAFEGVIDAAGEPNTPESVAIDTGTGQVFVAGGEQVAEYDGSGALVEGFGSFPEKSIDAVAADSATGNVYVVFERSGSAGEGGTVAVFGSVISPTSITGAPSQEQSTSATVEGTVDPNGVAITECLFEYGPTTIYKQQPPAPCAPSAAELGEGTSPVPVSAELTGLIPNDLYHYRVVAGNGSASSKGADRTFHTLAVPPAVDDRPPSAAGITDRTVVLAGTVNPEHSATRYRFVYVAAAGYDPAAPNPYAAGASSSEIAAGEGFGDETVESARIRGLQPSTLYHYALVATSEAAGTAVGQDHEFMTAEPALPILGASSASAAGPTSVTLTDTVGLRGLQTSYEVDIASAVTCAAGASGCTGAAASYDGARIFGDAGLGAGTETLTLGLNGLEPGTTYHYRFVASNENGTSYGNDATFTTPGIPLAFLQPPTPALLPIPSFKGPGHKHKHKPAGRHKRRRARGRKWHA